MPHIRCGWINDPNPDNPAGLVSFQRNAAFFDAIHPLFYVIDGTFTLQRTSQDPNHLIEGAAQAAGTALWPYIFGPTDKNGFGQLLNDDTRRMNHVKALVGELRNPAYAGFEIDYEGIPNNYHDGFRRFLTELTDGAHGLGKQISITIGAWTTEQARATDYPNSCYNYDELLKIVDLIHPQFYDFHRVRSDGLGHLGPVAPLGYVDDALQVVVNTGAPQRFIYGMPNYGLTAKVMSGDPDPTVERGPGGQLQYGFGSLNQLRGQCDPSTVQTTTDHMRAPCPLPPRVPPCCAYENTDQNFAAGRQPNCRQAADPSTLQFFDDLDSLEERLKLAHDRGLGGVAYYTVGDELPGFFDMVRRYFVRWSPVYAQGDPGSGIGGYDLASPADRAFAFDYDGSGKLDHLVVYRPGTGTIWILKK
jgi:spore germination protein YaaH